MIDVDVMQGYIRDANPILTLDDLDPDELTAFVTVARTRRAEIMQAPTQHPTTPSTPVTPPPQRRRKALVFAAAFILVVAAIGIAALVTRDSGDAPVADDPMAPVTVTTAPPTTSAPDPIDVQSLTWSRVPYDEAVFKPTGGDSMLDIAVGGPGFVAVGQIGDFGGAERDPGVWVSEDGITWSLVNSVEGTTTDPMGVDPLSEPGFQIMERIMVGGPGLVAVGTDGPIWPGAVVWTSEDGISWSKSIIDSEGGALIRDVIAGGPGLVAVGTVLKPDAMAADAEWVGAIWTSVDGITWNRVRQDLRVEWMASLTAGGPGLVAVGTLGDEVVMWTSTDGLTWTRVPYDEAVFGGFGIRDVVAGGPGFVAVGSDESGSAVWTSPDGFTWTRVPHDPDVFGGRSMDTVFSVGSQLIAFGGNEAFGSTVWTSVDGVTWTRSVILGGYGIVHSLAVSDGGLIAVGGQDGAAAVWIATEG